MLPRRTLELRLAFVVIAAAAAFTALVLAWRCGYDGAPWSLSLPPRPRLRGLDAFGLYLWLQWVGRVAIVAMFVGVIVRWVTGWRAATRWIAFALPPLVCLMAAGIYAPFWGATARRVDRVGGAVEEPVFGLRGLALNLGVTFVLAAVFILVTRRRRIPESVRQVALVVPAILAGILLNLIILFVVLPASNEWMPVEWRRRDLLAPFRPCRGAILWFPPDPGKEFVRPFGRIDDVWLRFAGEHWAVSGEGEWEEGYFWLTRAEAMQLRVRSDDPAVLRCDSRPRPEPVSPASWHRVGLE